MGKKTYVVIDPRKDRAWILEDLEVMALDLQTILDELSDTDEWTVGELKRLGVLAQSVVDGARAVMDVGVHPFPAVNPSLSVASRNPSTVWTPSHPRYADLHG